MRRILSNILWMLQNLLAGVRLAIFLPVARRSFHFSIDQALVFLALAIAAGVFSVSLYVGKGIAFAPDLWTVLGSRAFIALLLYYLISRIQRAPHTFAAVAVTMLSVSVFFALIHIPLRWVPWSINAMLSVDTSARLLTLIGTLVVTALSVWAAAVASRSIRLIYSTSWIRAGLIGTAIAAAGIGMNWVLPIYTWSAPLQANRASDRGTEENVYVDTERTYYAQSRVLANHLAALAPAREGIGELYFLGFAGTSTQDVFLKEVRAAQALFDGRFDTRNRSLILVNNPQTVETLPVASVTNLYWAMAGIAKKMHVEDDILFLYLTSHGSAHEFSVNFPQLALNNLSDQKLRSLLDRAGIKWRVIVISACYSGSFIDALKDDHTLILTAAAADRTSFGCGNEDDFTYFGDAFINQALRQDRSFIDSFEKARDTIAAREAAEKKTPSNPQIYVGAAMREKLRELEQRLAGASQDAGTE